MGKHVKEKLISDIKEAIYFSIILDSTPDVSHTDQLTFILRYVDKEGKIQESFLGFLPILRHEAKYLEQIVIKTLEDLTIDIKYCRGQTYDNAANMVGQYSGLQARIKKLSPNAFFIPCTSHSINSIASAAAESCTNAIHFFDFIKNLFAFFSSSTRRWEILISSQRESITVKRICDTRWSARADSILAVKLNYKGIKEALLGISKHDAEKLIGKIEAKKFYNFFDDYENALLLILWNTLLQRINATSKSLQDKECNLHKGVELLKSLSQYILHVRSNIESIEKEAALLTDSKEWRSAKGRIKKRKLHADETAANDVILKGRQLFIVNTVYVICDALHAEINRRIGVYEKISELFKIFIESELSKPEFDICVSKLTCTYNEDIDVNVFEEEVTQFLLFSKEEKLIAPEKMYTAIQDGLISTFPNVEIILKIFLTMSVSNASGERSFSVLKRVKNYLRNSLGQEKLGNLALMFIESKLTKKIDYTTIIDKFSMLKSRKVYV